MHLVNDINLITPFCRRILYLINDIPDIADTIVGCRINLDHIHRGLAVDLLTHCTLVAWTSIHRRLTVDCLCHDLCNRGLTGTSCTAKQIGMTDPVCLDLVAECRHDLILSFNLTKAGWSKFAI